MRQKRLCALMLVASMAAGVLGGCGNEWGNRECGQRSIR